MSINPNTLKLRITNTTASLTNRQSRLSLSYEIYHDGTGAIVARNTISENVGAGAGFIEADKYLLEHALEDLDVIRWQFGPMMILDGLSPFEASLCLRYWSFEYDGSWELAHPISGEFSNVQMGGGTLPALPDRVAAILSLVLKPPMWAWASSPETGKLEAHCVAVQGADSYNVYHDNLNGTFNFIGSAPTHNGGTITVDPGTYNVRMAAVKDGTVGIMSHSVTVVVE